MTFHSNKNAIRSADFDFEVPAELIAVEPRLHNTHRMMAYHRATGKIDHHRFDTIVDILPPASLIVVNNSKVVKSSIPLLSNPLLDLQVLNPKSPSLDAMVVLCPYPAAEGETFDVMGGMFTVTDIPVAGKDIRRGRFTILDKDVRSLDEYLEKYAQVALPKYISSQRVPVNVRESAFQTIFASMPGSLTCPTAGLHFTPELVSLLRAAGHEFLEVTLHIGFGSWGSLETGFVGEFDLDEELIKVDLTALLRLRKAKQTGQRILAVGTTTVRTLETIANDILSEIKPQRNIQRLTNLLIYPGHEFKVVDMLLTDFAYPRTPVMMMSAAFCGLASLQRLYQEAIQMEYKFDIFGDALAIL